MSYEKESFHFRKLSSPIRIFTPNFSHWSLISIFPLLFSAFFLLSEPLAHASPKNKQIPFTQEDRQRLIRLEVKKISPVEAEIAENRSKLHLLISALKELGERDKELAEILRRFNLM